MNTKCYNHFLKEFLKSILSAKPVELICYNQMLRVKTSIIDHTSHLRKKIDFNIHYLPVLFTNYVYMNKVCKKYYFGIFRKIHKLDLHLSIKTFLCATIQNLLKMVILNTSITMCYFYIIKIILE